MQIIQQPDGSYALWDNTIDDFVLTNATQQMLVSFMLSLQRAKITQDVERICSVLQSGGKPYYQFTMTFDEALEQKRLIHGV